MAKRAESHSDMAQARWSDGVNVIFDQKSPVSSRSRSRSSSSSSSSSSSACSSPSSDSGYYRRRGNDRGRCRSSSSSSSATSSSSRSSSRSRSRSRPRCHRPSSRCRCEDHRRYGSGRPHYSPRRRYRAHSRSYSRSRTPDRYSRRRYYRSSSRSRSRSVSRWSRYRRQENHFRVQFSRSPSRPYRERSRSRSHGSSVSLSLHDKRKLLEAAKANAKKILGVEKLELPESVKPILSLQSESTRLSPEPTRVRQGSERNASQDNEPDVPSPKMSPKGRIAFSINNSVAKPTVAAPSSAKVTPRMDSYESRKPYGHWIPIGSGRTSSTRKRLDHMS